MRAQSSIASTLQIFLPLDSSTTDLIFNLFAIELIQLMPFELFLIQVVSPPLTLQISLLSHGLSFLVLVSTLMLRDFLTLTISSSSQPLSPL
jgi:hypothetical protein